MRGPPMHAGAAGYGGQHRRLSRTWCPRVKTSNSKRGSSVRSSASNLVKRQRYVQESLLAGKATPTTLNSVTWRPCTKAAAFHKRPRQRKRFTKISARGKPTPESKGSSTFIVHNVDRANGDAQE
jgi:hypothetical protein